MDRESVSEHTPELVLERDGENCWLCGSGIAIQISHQIDPAAIRPFAQFRANETIPAFVSSPSHVDNLFPLCSNCRTGYDLTFPDWVLVPDTETLNKYINHEKQNYEERYQRYLLSPSPFPISPRTLPPLDRNKIFYHPLFTTEESAKFYLNGDTNWPKRWLGEPTTTIHWAARHDLFDSTPIRPISLGNGRQWQTGVPDIFRKLIEELTRLWARQATVEVTIAYIFSKKLIVFVILFSTLEFLPVVSCIPFFMISFLIRWALRAWDLICTSGNWRRYY